MKLAVDGILFGYVEQDLKILLIRRKYAPYAGAWALPGGFVWDTESVDEAIARELFEETGIKDVFLEQLYTFGEVDRDPRYRVVSIAYYGLVRPERYELVASTDADDAKWFSLSALPELAFDHEKVIAMAHTRLRNKIRYQPIGFELLPDQFILADVKDLYETILGEKFNLSTFRNKILSFGILERTGQYMETSKHRPPEYYRFNKEAYDEAAAKDFYFKP